MAFLTERFKSGDGFALHGFISQMVRVESTVGPEGEPAVRFIFFTDTAQEKDRRRAFAGWQRRQTLAWLKDEEFTEDEPTQSGPALYYISFGDTVETMRNGLTHLGTVGETEFFTGDQNLFGGLGDLFGL